MLGVFGLGGGELIIILVALLLMATPVPLVLLIVWWVRQNQRHSRDTLRDLAASGATVEPAALAQSAQRMSRQFDLRVGIILIMTGIGIGAGLFLYDHNPALGIVPFCIGAGFLITSRIGTGQQ